MLFTQPAFLFYFLPISLLLFRISLFRQTHKPYPQAAHVTLLLCTLFFYGYQNRWWLIPFGITVGFDFLWASWLSRETRPRYRTFICSASIVQNIGLLSFFKYSPFIFHSLASLFPRWFGHQANHFLTLPPGISFYTFESLSFVIDIYRRKIAPPKSPVDFFGFIGMFPRFIAGPIVRYQEMEGQFRNYRGLDLEKGLYLFIQGFFFKCVFADSLATLTPYAFGRSDSPEFLAAWLGVGAFTFQIYFDFAGYSLMAIGLGRCLGFEFPANFQAPYRAASLSDFWRRWHITLSNWLRDYVYISLGGNRKGTVRTYFNLFLTLLLGGLWHGAGYTFLLWGTWHGGWLVAERAWPSFQRFPVVIRRFATLLIVMIGWVLFNSRSLEEAVTLIYVMASPWRHPLALNCDGMFSNPIALVLSILGLIFCLAHEARADRIEFTVEGKLTHIQRVLALTGFLFALLMVVSTGRIPFLYFQF